MDYEYTVQVWLPKTAPVGNTSPVRVQIVWRDGTRTQTLQPRVGVPGEIVERDDESVGKFRFSEFCGFHGIDVATTRKDEGFDVHVSKDGFKSWSGHYGVGNMQSIPRKGKFDLFYQIDIVQLQPLDSESPSLRVGGSPKDWQPWQGP